MRKHVSIVRKLRPCLPEGPTNSARMAHHSDCSVAVVIFSDGTYFENTPRGTIGNSYVTPDTLRYKPFLFITSVL
jgi:hypothetical protein